MAPLARNRMRRGSHTPRGQQTRGAILAAARQMCSEHWLDELSLAELARVAGTTRASVLFQFPEGWLGIAAELLTEELLAACATTTAIAELRLKPSERLSRALHSYLARGEELGAFMPNIRAYNFVWGEAIDAVVEPAREAALDVIAMLVRQSAPGRQSMAAARNAAELLLFYCFDLTCAPMYRRLRPEERVAKLDAALAFVIKGLARK